MTHHKSVDTVKRPLQHESSGFMPNHQITFPVGPRWKRAISIRLTIDAGQFRGIAAAKSKPLIRTLRAIGIFAGLDEIPFFGQTVNMLITNWGFRRSQSEIVSRKSFTACEAEIAFRLMTLGLGSSTPYACDFRCSSVFASLASAVVSMS